MKTNQKESWCVKTVNRILLYSITTIRYCPISTLVTYGQIKFLKLSDDITDYHQQMCLY